MSFSFVLHRQEIHARRARLLPPILFLQQFISLKTYANLITFIFSRAFYVKNFPPSHLVFSATHKSYCDSSHSSEGVSFAFPIGAVIYSPEKQVEMGTKARGSHQISFGMSTQPFEFARK